VTPEENAAFLAAVRDLAASAAAPVATAMGKTMKDQVQRELKLTAHPPGVFWKAAEGRPPAFASGNLFAQTFYTPAAGEVRATSLVGNTAIYASIQEFGGSTWPSRSAYMHWVNSRGSWYKKLVTIPEHPYFRPALEKIISDGSLQAAAMEAFAEHMAPLLS
jgi:phage gpG-like protein